MTTPKSAGGFVRTERVSKDLVETYRSAIHDVLVRGFYPFESVCSALDVSNRPETQAQLNLLVDYVLQDGVSVIARRVHDNQIIGVAINKIQQKAQPGETSFFESFANQHISNEVAKQLIHFMAEADSQVDLFTELGTDRVLELMFLGVVPEGSGAGAGKALVAASEQSAVDEGIVGICSLFTGKASQVIGKARGFRSVATFLHSDFSFDGVPLSERLREDQQFSLLCVKNLQ